jgi:hypothetical protein
MGLGSSLAAKALIGHQAAEALSYRGDGLGEEVIELAGQRGERGKVLPAGRLQALAPSGAVAASQAFDLLESVLGDYLVRPEPG